MNEERTPIIESILPTILKQLYVHFLFFDGSGFLFIQKTDNVYYVYVFDLMHGSGLSQVQDLLQLFGSIPYRILLVPWY